MKLKVCGLKYKDNIEQVAAVQPDYLGFIFYDKSKRYVGEDFQMPEVSSDIVKVGVFVNAAIEYVIGKILKFDLKLIQLHGDEGVEYCENLADMLSLNERTKPVKIMKAFGVDESFDFNVLVAYQECCDYFLFDTKTKNYGGSGKQFDWKVLDKYNLSTPYFLSGGIGLGEIDKVLKLKSKVYAIDVNSQFEIEPGLKDVEKVKSLRLKVR